MGMDMSSQIGSYAGGGATVTTGAAQALYGLYLDKKARNMEHNYNIPPEIQQNLNMANARALEGLPAEQKAQYLENLNKSTDYNLSNSGDLKSGTIGVAGANNAMNNGYMNLLSADSSARAANQNVVYGMNQNMADYREKERYYNKILPYENAVREAQGFKGAGMQNVSQGFQSGNSGGNPYGGGGGGGEKNVVAPNTQQSSNYSPYVNARGYDPNANYVSNPNAQANANSQSFMLNSYGQNNNAPNGWENPY